MKKEKCIVQITIPETVFRNYAESYYEHVFVGEFEQKILNFAGVVEYEFVDALVNNKVFRKTVTDIVIECGTKSFDDVSDYCYDFDLYEKLSVEIPAIEKILCWVEEASDIVDEAETDYEHEIKHAFQILKKHGVFLGVSDEGEE